VEKENKTEEWTKRTERRIFGDTKKASKEDWVGYSRVLERELLKKYNSIEDNRKTKSLDKKWQIIEDSIVKAANKCLPKSKGMVSGENTKQDQNRPEKIRKLRKAVVKLGKKCRLAKKYTVVILDQWEVRQINRICLEINQNWETEIPSFDIDEQAILIHQ
ncbi:5030_t:CDS:1, partial [Gigaspora rosea]